MARWMLMMVLLLTTACSGNDINVKFLAKSDIDMVADLHYQQSDALLRELAWKLYRRNTGEWRKSGLSLEKLTDRIFAEKYEKYRRQQLQGKTGVEAIELALMPDYRGDRIFALMTGLHYMIRKSYGFRQEFYITTGLDGQKLYNSARNIEVLVWRISNERDVAGDPLILTNSLPAEVPNLSYERLFGKLIANQDMLAMIVAQKNKRVIKTVVHNVASMVFLPI